MNERQEIRGSIRSGLTGLMRARVALEEGLEDQECMLSPLDMELVQQTIREMEREMRNIKNMSGKFASVAEVRKELFVTH